MFVGSTAADLKIGSNRVKAVRQGADLRYFRPDSISGLKLWLDADDASTITESTGVSVWADKSSAGNDANMTGSGTRQPTLVSGEQNGRSVIRFDGSLDMLEIPDSKSTFKFIHNGSPAVIFAVVRGAASSAGNLGALLGTAGGVAGNVGISLFYDNRNDSNGMVYPYISGGGGRAIVLADRVALREEFSVVAVEVDADAATADRLAVYGDGTDSGEVNVTTGTPSSADSTFIMQIGSSGNYNYPLDGDIAEVLIYDAELTTDQRQLVEGYLAHKWGLQSKLPYDHPYASSFYGVQTLPTDTDVLAFAAASGAVSIPDLLKIEDLVAYLKAESLWDYARFYPMKAAQNAGSGSTVYGLGGLTSNNMTLVNSPTWGSDGVTFNGSTQYGNIGDVHNGTPLHTFARVAFSSGAPSASEVIFGVYIASATNRSFEYYRKGDASGDPFVCTLSSSGLSGGIDSIETTDHTVSSDDECLSASFLSDGQIQMFQGETQLATQRLSGSAQPSGPFDTGQDIYFAARHSLSGAVLHADFLAICPLWMSGVSLTTTQRETITDLINAL